MRLIKTRKNLQTINFVITIIKCDFLVLKPHAHATTKKGKNFVSISHTLHVISYGVLSFRLLITLHDTIIHKSRASSSRDIFLSRKLLANCVYEWASETETEKVSYFCVIVSSFGRLRRRQVTEKYCLRERFTFFLYIKSNNFFLLVNSPMKMLKVEENLGFPFDFLT